MGGLKWDILGIFGISIKIIYNLKKKMLGVKPSSTIVFSYDCGLWVDGLRKEQN